MTYDTTTITTAPTVTVTNAQGVSNDYFYFPIPSDFLYSLELEPTVQVSSLGKLAGCRNHNCAYNPTAASTPTVTAATATVDTDTGIVS